MSLRALLLLAVFGLASAGCAQIAPRVNEKPVLPSPRMSRDSVIVEMTTVEISAENLKNDQQLWSKVDEQHLPVEVRRRLAAAGVRCGIAGTELPTAVQSALTAVRDEPQVASTDGQLLSVNGPRRRRLQCRSGERHQLMLAEVHDELSVLWRDEGRVHGTTFSGAQPMFVLRAFPQQSGQVRIVLAPQILHGDPQTKWVGRDGMFLMETGKQQEKFDDLTMELTLAPGEYLLVGSSDAGGGLGECLFHAPDHPGKRKMIVFRLAQTQLDDLHPAAAASKPLVTGG